MPKIYGLLLIAALVLWPFAGARAAGVDLRSIEPLAVVDHMPEAEFTKKTQLIEEAPFGDEALSFSIRLPKDWTAEVPPPDAKNIEKLSPSMLGELARYVSPSRLTLRSSFTLEALQQTYEVSARNWLINYLLNNGHTLNALTEISEREVEALYVVVDGDITYAVRAKAFINGPRVIVARYFVPQEDYQAERTMQAQALNSFKLLKQQPGGIEKWKTFGFLDQSFFDYPESWTLKAPLIKSIERMRAMLYTGMIQGKPEGQINVYLSSRLLDTSLSAEVERYRDKLIDIPNYAMGPLIDSYDVPYSKDIDFGAMEAYKLIPQPITMMHYELVVAVMQGRDYYYMITLLTPARDAEFYIWSRNMRAFRVVVETMRRYNTQNDDYYGYLQE